jgi:hypothetical protein
MGTLAMVFAGCKEESPATTECQIEYKMLGAAESNRTDLLLAPSDEVVKRLVREDGDEDTASIYYRFDNPEFSARVHELDEENDGTIDSTMERSERLVDRIDLYQVDAIADDGLVDSLQVSVPLESNQFGPWNPARMFYTIPCGPSHELTASEDQGLVTIRVDLNEDASVDTEMRMFFADDKITAWTVDHEIDGVIDFRGKATYRDDGKVASVEWRNWEFETVSVSTWEYDENGLLVGFQENMNGDDTIENELVYKTACWEGSDETE